MNAKITTDFTEGNIRKQMMKFAVPLFFSNLLQAVYNMNWMKENHPELLTLYQDIYEKKDRSFWSQLDAEMREFTAKEGLPYVRDDDSMKRPFSAPPAVVNYFFHEEIIPSAKRKISTVKDLTGDENHE